MRTSVLVVVAMLAASPAWARFGKSGSGGTSGGGSSSGRSSGSSSGSTHGAVPLDSARSSSSSGSNQSSGGSSSYYVPPIGYGYGSRSLFRPWYATPVLMPVSPGMTPQPQPSSITGRVNGEFMYFVANANHGYAINVNAAAEGDIFGVNLSGQNIQVKADDGSNETDSLTQLNAHLTVAVLSGELGRLRLEAGGDVIFAPSIITAGLSFGASGIIGIYGPMAFEGSFYATVYPFTQLDGRAALVFGSGPIGLKIGWRTQLLDDRGLADGVPHRDIFMGPYAALGLAF